MLAQRYVVNNKWRILHHEKIKDTQSRLVLGINKIHKVHSQKYRLQIQINWKHLSYHSVTFKVEFLMSLNDEFQISSCMLKNLVSNKLWRQKDKISRFQLFFAVCWLSFALLLKPVRGIIALSVAVLPHLRHSGRKRLPFVNVETTLQCVANWSKNVKHVFVNNRIDPSKTRFRKFNYFFLYPIAIFWKWFSVKDCFNFWTIYGNLCRIPSWRCKIKILIVNCSRLARSLKLT